MFHAQRVSGSPYLPAAEDPVEYTCVDGQKRFYSTRDLEDLSSEIKEKIRNSIASAKKLAPGESRVIDAEDEKFLSPEGLSFGDQKNTVILSSQNWAVDWESLEDPKDLIAELKEAVKPWPVSDVCGNAFIDCPYRYTTLIAVDSAFWITSPDSHLGNITCEFVAPEDIKLSLGGVGLSQGSSIKITSLHAMSLRGLSEGMHRNFPAKVSIMEGEFVEKHIEISCHNAKIYISVPLMAEAEKVDVAGEVLAKHQKELPLSIGEGNVYVETLFGAISGGMYPPVSADMMLSKPITVVRKPDTNGYILNTEKGVESLSFN